MKPQRRPDRPQFSSGPCAKRPGWSLANLEGALLGRSHRSGPAKGRLQEVLDRSRTLLRMPEDYRIAIVPASDTGAVEMALWSLLGERGVEVLAWESFGRGWLTDIETQLGITDLRPHTADYGELPDLSAVDFARDVVFTWNGTTSGVRVPGGQWIPDEREGLTLCDATSAVFAMEVPFEKLDVVTWSWQKVLGGEAGHGMLVLSPRAVERLERFTPPRPLPKIFRMTRGGQLIEGLFEAATINTPSMLAVEDAVDALRWVEEIGGVPTLIARSEANLASISKWVDAADWIDFLAGDPATRSCTSICLKIVDPWFTGLAEDERAAAAKKIGTLLDSEGVAFDIGSYKDAPPGLRVWGGATVENADIEALLPWLDWAWERVKQG
ncbi:MAG: phosphoserine transaminase [Deltaproteobacteria bacterium]|jgi:phosphoserine aminotransferase|nr:phosphoserine transaminase [Deltaproteobacteria bacterium]MBW2384178.1 phosphoserine transaminase [Deltaproteobacteria bacterium]MBW2697973.1 phosphoserine transaminase [Deltaproteobacteria bacterium]